MSKTFTSQPSRQTTTRQRSVTRRAPLNKATGTSSRIVGARSLNMDNGLQNNQGHGNGLNSPHTTGQQNSAAGTGQRLQSPQRTATYAGGFTVIPPNEMKRQQISQMAQREAEAYESYKQANAVKHVSHVGRVGGGVLTEEQARKEQERALRRQKLDRLTRQEEQRKAKKNAEEAEIAQKRAAARRQAEQNAIRNSIAPPADEIRRNREAFLNQLEKKPSSSTA
ncbi:hypothetical protein BsWGS_03546 [Bradybaena similaris]